MAKTIKLNEDRLDAINSFADNIGKVYEDLAKMANRIRKIAIGLSLDDEPKKNMHLRVDTASASCIINKLDDELSDDEYFNTLEKLVSDKDERVKLMVCHGLFEELDTDIEAKKKTISKLEERIHLSEDANSSEVKIAKKRLEVFKNNLVIREGRRVRVLEYFFKLRYSLAKSMLNSTDGIIACMVTGDKYSKELVKRYDIRKLFDKIAEGEDVFGGKTKGE